MTSHYRMISWSLEAARLVLLDFPNLSAIWWAPRQQRSRATNPISERYDHYSIQYCGFKISGGFVSKASYRLMNRGTGSLHYHDVMMSGMASPITSLTIVYSTVYSGADQRKHQSSASLAFVRGIHRGPVNSPHKGPVTRKTFPFWWRHHWQISCIRLNDESYCRWQVVGGGPHLCDFHNSLPWGYMGWCPWKHRQFCCLPSSFIELAQKKYQSFKFRSFGSPVMRKSFPCDDVTMCRINAYTESKWWKRQMVQFATNSYLVTC